MNWLVILALAGFAGWTVTLIFLSKSILPMANALNALGKLGGYEDEKIRKVIERIQERTGGVIPPPPKVPAREHQQSGVDAVRQAFGGDVFQPIGEQPPSDADELEVVG